MWHPPRTRRDVLHDRSWGGYEHVGTGKEKRNFQSCFLRGLYPIRSLAIVAWVKTLLEGDGYQIGGKFVEPNLEVGAELAILASEQ